MMGSGRITDTNSQNPAVRRASDATIHRQAQRFGEALRMGDARRAEAVAEDVIASGVETAVVHARVIAPAMQAIGALWERDAIGVADEHLATAISHNVLARLFPRLLTAPPRSRERVMLAAAHGEHHVLGLRMAADVLEGAGFDVVYLGPDVPLDALLDACRKHRPAVLGLTASMALNVPVLLRELVEVSRLDDAPLLVLGGRALGPATSVGLSVPVIAHVDEAVRAIEALIASGTQGPPLDDALLARIPHRISTRAGHAEIGTVPHHFSAAALASADTARESARRASAMEHLALHDPLTGMWNRRAFDDRFADLADGASDLTLLMVDVDRFKHVNDTYGHDVGDLALVGIAVAMLANIRPGDFAARYGGDEFIVLLPDASTALAAEIAERIRAGVAATLHDPPVTVSVGLARFAGDRRLAGITVDQALYQAKAAGRNCVSVGAA
jgi:diguanylate cyclase (GGDEF)-like protein